MPAPFKFADRPLPVCSGELAACCMTIFPHSYSILCHLWFTLPIPSQTPFPTQISIQSANCCLGRSQHRQVQLLLRSCRSRVVSLVGVDHFSKCRICFTSSRFTKTRSNVTNIPLHIPPFASILLVHISMESDNDPQQELDLFPRVVSSWGTSDHGIRRKSHTFHHCPYQ